MIQAFSVGHGVQNLIDQGVKGGKVYSCFRSAVYINVADNFLIAIVFGSDRERHFMAVNLPYCALFPWRVNESVFFDNNKIYGQGGDVIILKDSPRWQATSLSFQPHGIVPISAVAKFITDQNLVGGLNELLQFLSHDSLLPPLSLLAKHALVGMNYLLKGLHWVNPELVRKGTKFLAGLGPGLTPSGDDVLAGLIGAWWWSKLGNFSKKELLCLQTVVREVQTMSNMYSYQEVRSAAQGELPESAVYFIHALMGDRINWQAKALILASLGSTSGIDMLTGICFGLSMVFDERFDIMGAC